MALKANCYYLIVCRLEPENNVKEILEGFSASDSPHPLVVLGNHLSDSPYVKKLREIRDERIRFAGTVYDKDTLRALRYNALAYFHGHTVGGTNPSLLEALGCGNTVIAHDNVFNREVAGDAALYFGRPEDIPGIIERLETSPPEMREERRKAARARIQGRYTWNRIANEYMFLMQRELREAELSAGRAFRPLYLRDLLGHLMVMLKAK